MKFLEYQCIKTVFNTLILDYIISLYWLFSHFYRETIVMFYLWLLWVRFQSWAELQLCFCPKLYGNICQTHWKKAKNLGLNSKYVAVLIEGKFKFRVHRKHIWKNFLVDVTIGHKKLAGKFFSKPWNQVYAVLGAGHLQ